MPLATLTLQQFVQAMITTWGAAVGVAPTFSSGDVLLAMFQAVGTQDEFLLGQIQLTAALTRAATSNGPDLDSWVEQFGMSRLPATAASGPITFGKNGLANAPIQIPVGTQVQSSDGLVQFIVVGDSSQPGYNAALNAYVLAAGQSSVIATAVSVKMGSAGNVSVGQISQAAVNLPGIDTVTNATAIQNGQDAETDPALRARIPGYFASLRTGILPAIIFAATSVQLGGRFQPVNALPRIGSYTLYADDGSGAAPDSFIAAITAAVQSVTSFGVTPVVMRPAVVTAEIACTLQVSANADRPTVVANVDKALATYNSTLQIGGGLSYLNLPAVIMAADPGVTGINSLTINGGTAPIAGAQGTLVVATRLAS